MTDIPSQTAKRRDRDVSQDPRWLRILARDRTADGTFWFSVVTTGVYCRPSCPSRAANPANVRIHDTLEAAKATGFRPCKRCKPDGPSVEIETASLIAKACRLIERSETEPTLATLADAVALSPGYFHRLFKTTTGVTPKDYAAAHRARRVRAGLDAGRSVTETVYAAGFGSDGRFYEQTTAMLGMTPTRYRAGGANETIRFAVGISSLGALLVACSDKGVAAILLGEDPEALVRDLQDRFSRACLVGDDSAYGALVAHVVGLAEKPSVGLALPLDVRGTAFQRRVWRALQDIPLGQTASYAEIARTIGAPKAVRAVAGACAANNIALAIPCHRVVRSDGALSGYAWGIGRKKKILDKEAAIAKASASREGLIKR
jgi:AraC family transcriptional regulator of adaptative response/methylated-DNA-[protein]-cysteine methyltransferase